MNSISLLFTNPVDANDQAATDKLELFVSGELVQAVRQAKGREAACKILWQLDELIDDADGLTEDDPCILHDWIDRASRILDPEEYAGWSHRTGR
jgi:hypothetical protein